MMGLIHPWLRPRASSLTIRPFPFLFCSSLVFRGATPNLVTHRSPLGSVDKPAARRAVMSPPVENLIPEPTVHPQKDDLRACWSRDSRPGQQAGAADG
ncbi:hypothetical protein, partial [Nesterenkonia xinjiangensis]|uniref:hypothetical protein n=1 Tax=Nesterenkonia xinjiangensis TaxID=225327 RepID=UPI0031D145FB